MGKRIKIGDIIEIPTEQGYAYAQYTHVNKLMGNLIRVKPGLFVKRPIDTNLITKKENQIITFVPLQVMINRSIVTIISNEDIPVIDSKFPLFRNGIKHPEDNTRIKWWIWDGEKETLIGEHLNEEQKKYPLQGIWNDTLLKERIISGWSHKTSDYF